MALSLIYYCTQVNVGIELDIFLCIHILGVLGEFLMLKGRSK